MQRWLIAAILVTGLAFLLPVNGREDPPARPVATYTAAPPEITLISHAAGGLDSGAYSNSLEAMNGAYARGLRIFEVDFSWTRDDHLVLVHDWDNEYRRWFERPLRHSLYERLAATSTVPDLETFKALTMRDGLTQLTLPDLLAWMRRHPDARVVSDIKARNVEGLRLISSTGPDLREAFIPQIFDFADLEAVRALGFESVIFTAYASSAGPDDIAEFANRSELFAVTVPAERIKGDWLTMVDRIEAPVFTHTVNDAALAAKLARMGISGVYTDYLSPPGEATRR